MLRIVQHWPILGPRLDKIETRAASMPVSGRSAEKRDAVMRLIRLSRIVSLAPSSVSLNCSCITITTAKLFNHESSGTAMMRDVVATHALVRDVLWED